MLLGFALRIAATAAHVGEDGVIDAVEVAPAANRIVALIAFDEAILRRMKNGSKGKGFFGGELRYDEVFGFEQRAACAEDEALSDRVGVDVGAEVDAEILD